MYVSISPDASDPLDVRFRADLRADDGGFMFIDIGNVSMSMAGPQARELRDALTTALDAPAGEQA